jgi:hypothetical protein
MKKIVFKYESDNAFIDPVVPASKALPEWWKKAHIFKDGEPPYGVQSIKACMPFFDAMTQGYIVPLWSDIYVKVVEGEGEDGESGPVFTWKEERNTPIAGHFPSQTEGFPVREESKTSGGKAWKFANPWIIQTPPGYSTLFVAPLNNPNPNFKMISGIVATDEYKTQITFPFIWTGPEGYEGTIKQGTPLIQLIPFKRDNFKHELKAMDANDLNLMHSTRVRMTQAFTGVYKNLWRRPTKSI